VHLGLELPLHMMAKLVAVPPAHSFDSRVFLKGFSALFAAMRISQDLILWHHVFNKEEQHISYLNGFLMIVSLSICISLILLVMLWGGALTRYISQVLRTAQPKLRV
jgi:hypothetical protein